MTVTEGPEVQSLLRRYDEGTHEILLTGVQALVRLPLEQRRLDNIRGLDTAVFVSGYEGSPLGGYDLEIQRNAALFEQSRVLHRSAINEDLAATSVGATQHVPQLDGRTVEGVTGIWYGKAPGLDRSMDAIRHANLMGTHRSGGVLALVGDDPSSKSSTIPSASESALKSLGVPVLYPADAEEALLLGLHGIAMSRASGLWSALKIVTNVADGHSSFRPTDLHRLAEQLPAPQSDYRHHVGIANDALGRREMEWSAYEQRLPIAIEYIRSAGINKILSSSEKSEIGIVSAGRTSREVSSALQNLGFDDALRQQWGVRILDLASVYPIPRETIFEFARGLKLILVVEEKRSFIESEIKEALYGRPDAPEVIGKRDSMGQPLVPTDADLGADRLGGPLRSVLTRFGELPKPKAQGVAAPTRLIPVVSRPNFPCSGCPHNRSLEVPSGSQVGIGIGCHALVTQLPEERVGNLITKTHMGGEGAQWLGIAPFMDSEHGHLFQNIGDGTFAHSGSLSVRAAVAADLSITFKLLYNAAVAMTGGQDVAGGLTVPQLTRMLEAEGVGAIAVISGDSAGYRAKDLARVATLHTRDELNDVQLRLQKADGVSVLIYDQECATELRRKRKRGTEARPKHRIIINERVCEGCGDCGYKSNCLSVEPIETPLGRKTRINQSTCNFDYSCIEGDCPAFALVDISDDPEADIVDGPDAWEVPAADLASMTEPKVQRQPRTSIRLAGVGGTGVVTLAQVIAQAAKEAGLHVRGLDMTGLAQKGGAVTSDLVITSLKEEESALVLDGGADLVIGCDLIVASLDEVTRSLGRDAQAVMSTSETPTGYMVVDPDVAPQDTDSLLARLGEFTASEPFSIDADGMSDQIFGATTFANTILLGAAYQLGQLPMGSAEIEAAYGANGVQVPKNVAAFRWGRLAVVKPSARHLASASGGGELTLEWYEEELSRYQGHRYSERFRLAVDSLAERERIHGITEGLLVEPFARGLFKLMAYKDEYEVARLWLEPQDSPALMTSRADRKRTKILLQPPVLRSAGMKRKWAIGSWGRPALRLLKASRKVRGTPIDPFGYAKVRKIERALIPEYISAVQSAVDAVGGRDLESVIAIAELPSIIRGYEEIKLRNVDKYHHALTEHLESVGAHWTNPARSS